MNPSQRPIRIMRIIARLNIGGPAIHVALLSQRLGPPDYETTLVCGSVSPTEGDMRYYAEALQVEPLLLPELGRELHPLRDLVTLWKVYRLIRQYQPDIVHTHTAKAGFVGRIAAWLARVPVIIHTFHGHVFEGYFSPLTVRFFILLERQTARMSDTLIALTEGLRGDLAERYHIARRRHITVLPLGIDLMPFAQVKRKTGAFRRDWQIPANVPLIGIVGRLVPVKNHALFLAAAVEVLRQAPDAHFVVVGDGELRAEIEAQVAALGLAERVTFTGWVRNVAVVYADLDVLVISSLNEGTPVSVIEGLTAGCPVVATAVGGLPDLLDHGELGRLVPTRAVDALAAAIVSTLQTPPDLTHVKALMQDRYGIDRLVKDLDELYQGMLAKKRAQRVRLN